MSRKIIGVTVGTPLSPDKIKEKLNPELTSAVNTALAQAKESGLFDGKDGADGKDGYTPQKNVDYFDGKDGKDGANGKDGADGKDYVLTPDDKTEIAEMAADLVPVPEGGGISVTGATVGQTVKISAVDENGVPTAWESVDFPGGGGGGENPFELIIDTTVPENSERVIFREDLNGNQFEITDFVVWFDGASNSGLKTLTIFLRTHGGYLADNAEQYSYYGPLANISCRSDFNFMVKATRLSEKNWNVLHTPTGDSEALNYKTNVFLNKHDSVKQIAFIVVNASSGEDFRIVSGTRIMVWGRRV